MDMMTQHTKPPQTPAEEALVRSYGDVVGRLHGTPEITRNRDDAIEMIKASGLPTRRNEYWHYTDLRTRLRSFAGVAARPDRNVAVEAVNPREKLVDATRLPMFNGHYFTDLADNLPVGLDVQAFSDNADGGCDVSAWVPDLKNEDFIGTLNAAFFRDGLKIRLEENAVLERPVRITNMMVGETPAFSAVRHLVSIGKCAKATFIQRNAAPLQSANQTNAVTRLDIGEGAEVLWFVVHEGGKDAVDLSQIRVSLATDAKLTLYIMNAGGKLVRQEVIVDVAGEGADFQLRGVNLLAGDSHTDITMVVDHRVPDTTSTQIIRNVVLDRAQGVFQGQIRVYREAQKTDAKMACNTLLLSDEGGFSAKPELEIFADDVQCGHGATVTEIDSGYLFYLMSRGIPELEARGLLVKAFVAEIIEELDDDAFVEALENKLDNWFAENG